MHSQVCAVRPGGQSHPLPGRGCAGNHQVPHLGPGSWASAIQGHFPLLSEVMESHLGSGLHIPQNFQMCFSLEISLASTVPAILQTKQAGLLGVGRHVQHCTPTSDQRQSSAALRRPPAHWTRASHFLVFRCLGTFKNYRGPQIFYEGHIY